MSTPERESVNLEWIGEIVAGQATALGKHEQTRGYPIRQGLGGLGVDRADPGPAAAPGRLLYMHCPGRKPPI